MRLFELDNRDCDFVKFWFNDGNSKYINLLISLRKNCRLYCGV